MSEFTRGQEIEAVQPIRLANGITLEVGERGKVIGMGSHDTVSVQFENYIGGVSVWASLIAPVTTPAEPGAGEASELAIIASIRERVAAKHLDYPVSRAVHDVEILLEQYDLQRIAHHVNAERGNDFEAECERLRDEHKAEYNHVSQQRDKFERENIDLRAQLASTRARLAAVEAALRESEKGLEIIANWGFSEADKQTDAYKKYGGVMGLIIKEIARCANVTLTRVALAKKQASEGEGGE